MLLHLRPPFRPPFHSPISQRARTGKRKKSDGINPKLETGAARSGQHTRARARRDGRARDNWMGSWIMSGGDEEAPRGVGRSRGSARAALPALSPLRVLTRPPGVIWSVRVDGFHREGAGVWGDGGNRTIDVAIVGPC